MKSRGRFFETSGLVNIITPTAAVVMGGLALGEVPYDRWVRFAWKLVLIFFLLTVVFLGVSPPCPPPPGRRPGRRAPRPRGTGRKTGAIDAGVSNVIRLLGGREVFLIPVLMILFSLGGTSRARPRPSWPPVCGPGPPPGIFPGGCGP